MTFWNSTCYNDFQIDQTLHKLYDLETELGEFT